MKYTKTLTLGKTKYIISFDVNSFNHLCSFKELSNISLTRLAYSTQFGTDTEVKSPMNELDLKIFRNMFISRLTETNSYLGGSLKGFLYSFATGNRSRWGYVTNHQEDMLAFMKLLPLSSTYVLYSESSNASNVSPGTEEEEGIEELSMFNISTKGLKDVRDSETATYISEQLEVVNETLHTELTESSIRQYLRGNHAA